MKAEAPVVTDLTWSQVHAVNASHLSAGDLDGNGKSDLLVDFGSTYGIWKLLNGTTWSQLHTLTSTNILTADLDRADTVLDPREQVLYLGLLTGIDVEGVDLASQRG